MSADTEFWAELEIRLNMALAEISVNAPGGDRKRAGMCLISRIQSATRAILLLNDSDRSGFHLDSAALLRSAYDAHIQLLYMTAAADTFEERARLYLDFAHVEWHKMYRKVMHSPTPFAGALRSSPKRAAAEPRNLDAYHSVVGKFTAPGSNRTRPNWYPGDARTLAREVGAESEYDFIHSALHGAVHASPYAMTLGPMVSDKTTGIFAMRLLARSIRALASGFGVVFTNPAILDALCGWSLPLMGDTTPVEGVGAQ